MLPKNILENLLEKIILELLANLNYNIPSVRANLYGAIRRNLTSWKIDKDKTN